MMSATPNRYEVPCLKCSQPYSAHEEDGRCPTVASLTLTGAASLKAAFPALDFGCHVKPPKVGFDA